MNELQSVFANLEKYVEYISRNCDIYFEENNWTLSVSFSIHNWPLIYQEGSSYSLKYPDEPIGVAEASEFTFHIQHEAKGKVFDFDFSIDGEQFLNPTEDIGRAIVHLSSLTCELEYLPEEVEFYNFDINFTLEDALEVTAIKIREKYDE